MRMRRMKNLQPRMERCAELRIDNPAEKKGTWKSLKPDATALWVEVGCGKGKFTAETAQANPDVLLIAVERCREAMVVAMEKARDMGLTNVFFIDMDVANIEDIFAPGELDRLFINFPDPWPRKKNAKRRLTHRGFLDKYQGAAQRNPKLYGEFIHSVFAKTLMEQQMLLENAGLGGQELDPEIGILYRDISEFRDQDLPKAIHIIRSVAARINGDLSRRGRNRGQSGKLDFRGTIRKGLETGGSFYHLRYKKKRAHRKHLVLLCDVSGSMVQFSEFALRFIQSLNQVSESSRTFLFSETMVEADAFKLQNMDSFRTFVRDSSLYGRGTDLGTALEQLCTMKPPALSSATTLLILSDTKTIDQPRALSALAEAKRQAGRVIFLNPIPEGKWQYLRSVQSVAAICPMVSCSTLRELAAACRKLEQS